MFHRMTPWERSDATTHFEEPDTIPVIVGVSSGGYWASHKRGWELVKNKEDRKQNRYPESWREMGVGTPVTPAAWGGSARAEEH